MRGLATLLVALVLAPPDQENSSSLASFGERVVAGASVPLHLAGESLDAVLAGDIPEDRALEYIEISSPEERAFVTACLCFSGGISDTTRARLAGWLRSGPDDLHLQAAARTILECNAIHDARCRDLVLASSRRPWRPPVLALEALDAIEQGLREGRGRIDPLWQDLRILHPLLMRLASRPDAPGLWWYRAHAPDPLRPVRGTETWALRVLATISRRDGAHLPREARVAAGRLLARLPGEERLLPAARDLLAALDEARGAGHPGGAEGHVFALGYRGFAAEEAGPLLRAALADDDVDVRCAATIAGFGRGAPRAWIEEGFADLADEYVTERFAVAATLGDEALGEVIDRAVAPYELETVDRLLATSGFRSPLVVRWLRYRWSEGVEVASWPQIRCGLLLHRLGKAPEGLWELIASWIFRPPGSYPSREFDHRSFLDRLTAGRRVPVPDAFADTIVTWLRHARPNDLQRVALFLARFGAEHPAIRREIRTVFVDDPEPEQFLLLALLETPPIVPVARWPVKTVKRALVSPDAEIRRVAVRCAARVLAERADAGLDGALRAALRDGNLVVCGQALKALPLDHPAWRDATIRALSSPAPYLRQMAVSRLSCALRGSPELWIRNLLLETLGDPDPDVALATMVVLADASRTVPGLRATATKLLSESVSPRRNARLEFLLAELTARGL